MADMGRSLPGLAHERAIRGQLAQNVVRVQWRGRANLKRNSDARFAPHSRDRRRLALDARDRFIETGPGWRARRPDRRDGAHATGIVERAYAHEDEMRTRLRLAEQLCAADGAKPPVHNRAAVGDAAIVTRLACDRHGVSSKG